MMLLEIAQMNARVARELGNHREADAWQRESENRQTPVPSASQHLRIGYALGQGKLIEAIKIYRESTGADLKSAKEACEALRSGLQP